MRTVVTLTFGASAGAGAVEPNAVGRRAAGERRSVLVAVGVLELRRGSPQQRMPLALALAAVVLALVAAGGPRALEQGERSWATVQATREQQLWGRVSRTGCSAWWGAASGGGAGPEGDPSLFARLDAIRRQTKVHAVALVDGGGRLLAWSGDHRGPLPGAVLRRQSGVVYPGGTLFSYLYVVEPAGGGLRAVSAALMQAGPPVRGRTGSLADRFYGVTGERPRFGPGPSAGADWTLEVDGSPVLHARWPALSHAEWRDDVSRTGLRVVFGLVLLALGCLWAVWLRPVEHRSGPAVILPMAALSVTLMVAPLRAILGMERVFSPGFFVLPIPGDFLIEAVLVVLLPAAALVATYRSSAGRPSELWLRLAIAAGLAGGIFALGAALMSASAGPPMLAGGGPLWYVLMPATVILLTAATAPLLPRVVKPDHGREPLVYGAAAMVVSLALALALMGGWRPGGPSTTPLLFAWAVPFLLAARALAGYGGRGDRLLRWLAVGWLASTAVIPHLWVTSQASRLSAAETEIDAFGARTDPFLTYLLVRFGEELERAAARGERGGDLLYEAWVASGLAGEPYPLEISLWDEDLRRLGHLPLGVRLEPDSPADRELREILRGTIVRHEPENIPATGGGVGRFLTVPLEEDSAAAVSVAVAPRATLRPASPLSVLMETGGTDGVRLELLPTDGVVSHPDVGWKRTGVGWRREMVVREGADMYHAHLELRAPPPGVRLARGILLIALSLAVLTALWAAGRLARGDPPVPPGGWVGWIGGFRARLTVALFAFFLLPTAVFGWAAYRALAEEVTRAARQVAERAVIHAAAVLPETDLAETARRTGEDLLYYERGALRAASTPEAQELGLYSAWMPGDLYRIIRMGEAVGGSEMGELAGRSYLVSYRGCPRQRMWWPCPSGWRPGTWRSGSGSSPTWSCSGPSWAASSPSCSRSGGPRPGSAHRRAAQGRRRHRAGPPEGPAARAAHRRVRRPLRLLQPHGPAAPARPGPGAAHRARPGVGRDGPAGGPRDQEPLDAHQAVGPAHPARVRGPQARLRDDLAVKRGPGPARDRPPDRDRPCVLPLRRAPGGAR
jgi:two-component system, NtrC family, nitrogen regulation sensor histidine kinase NtrY